jgi:enolase
MGRGFCEEREEMSGVIVKVKGREILDSRGYPTLEVDVHLDNGHWGRGRVPSGASTGRHEVLEKRDGDEGRFCGMGVREVIGLVEGEIAEVLEGQRAEDQGSVDRLMCRLDGSLTKSRLGGNGILAVSMAVSCAASAEKGLPLYRYLGGISRYSLPVPFVNVLNGGAHADNGLDIQEFMIIPMKFSHFSEALRASSEVFMALKSRLRGDGYRTNVGDEGGFAPDIRSNREALDKVVQSIEDAGYRPGEDIFLGLDVAASEFADEGFYHLSGEGAKLDSGGMVDYLAGLVRDYPIVSIEDGMSEDDTVGWKALTDALGEEVLLVGDDVFVTSVERLREGVAGGYGNGLLVKPNQVGTVSETMEAVLCATRSGYVSVMSHRSGETEDVSIADYAVGLGCMGLKAGSVSRSERLAKYNRLLRIEEELGEDGVYSGIYWEEMRLRWKQGR